MSTNLLSTPLYILLAEDDIDDRFFFEKALREIPIETHLTSIQDGEQLMDYLEINSENLPDILFLDLSMPRKTGFECLSEIKENDKLKALSVCVFSTSFARDMDYEQNIIKTLSKMGAEEYIRKSTDFGQLKFVIQHFLKKVIDKKNQ